MKKTYIIPSTLIVHLNVKKHMADILTVSGNASLFYVEGTENDAKSDNGHSYNVWDDDWSAE